MLDRPRRRRQGSPLLIRIAQSLVLTTLVAAIGFLVFSPPTALDSSAVAAATVAAGSTPAPPTAADVAAPAPLPFPTVEPAAPPAPGTSEPAGSSPPAAAEGQVVEASTGKPLHGASVWVGAQEAVTDADGRFVVAGRPCRCTAAR